ncbi:C-type lectin domain family 4 member F-like [Thunnus maccoyii]|uniref:C-type lectin domain family 4 member F-like n=1 Tax=Thunnus maccoyii TaxID=8240 RepID=UPI001C4C6B3C|nr:C-type lectin domain family 4 member F-like [Thunnus maccoyii]
MERNQLWADNANLTSERDELQSSYSDVKSHNHNLTQKTSQLENENDHLQAVNNNLTKERDELQNHIDNKTLDFEASFKTLTEERDELKKKLTDFVHYSQQGWKYFSGSFYYISSNMKTWHESRTDCLQRGADLVVVNSEEEQAFINRYQDTIWIGLTDSEREGTWKWVDGTPLTTSFWHSGEPNNYLGQNEDCVETRFRDKNSWNDVICGDRNSWICEKRMFL